MRLCASIFTKTKMYYLQNKKLLIILSIWYNYLIALNEAFELTDVTPTTRIGKPKKIVKYKSIPVFNEFFLSPLLVS